MKLKVFENDPEFIALDLVANGKKDMKLCRDIGKYFPVTGLYIGFNGAIVNIGYDGTECSFKINKEARDAVTNRLEGLWSGYYKFLLSPSLDGCKFRFVAIKGKKEERQRGLLLGFIPPPVAEPKTKKAGTVKAGRQERIVEEEPSKWNRHLFDDIMLGKQTVQAQITEGE